MRKTRFFYGYQFLLGVLLVCMGMINMALKIQLDQKNAYFSEKETELAEKTEISQSSAGRVEKKDSSPESTIQTTPEPEPEEEKIIRVLLMDTGYKSYFHSSVSLVCNGQTMIYDQETMKPGDAPVTIQSQEAGIQVQTIQRQEGNPVYEGSLTISRREEGFLLVNELPLETYLEAVVPSEMPSGYEEEALKAQAVCARTYAWKQIQERGLEEYGADVDDSVNYQVYQNISPQESTTRAVRQTEGRILCQNGEPVEAYYFSTSAGTTSTDEIWGAQKAAAYLKSVPCTFDAGEPWSWWQVEIPWENLEQRAAAQMGQDSALLGISVIKKAESGAVTGLEIMTDAGSFLLEEEYSIREFLSPEGCTITEKDGTQAEGGTLLPSSYFSLEADPGTDVLLTGGGYGHGVGMSQNGANEMARQGYTCEEILNYFFKDVEIQKIP